MAKVKLTKNELKKQKDALKMFKRYLPTLQLKKQQLQSEIRGIQARARQIAAERDRLLEEFRAWIAVFGEESAVKKPDGSWILADGRVVVDTGNIAGVEIPIFRKAEFTIDDYDLFAKPLWVDRALDRLRSMLTLDLEIKVLEEQIVRLEHELRITTQRVNLFEKVKIPETSEIIRKIRIYLGDQQTAQVVRGKIAKNKVLERAAS
ncbi:MAG: V-type ATP synthase subunit D [Spirochaetes bacterium GWD1_61_31]|nr:MAG: V-type ATP synthase subunit D [Spirochaetes bacterium GWB1_60_80]OHD32790.1 MAG: V-type ATP synthase subunit D [Spirochaetes bacterium GWC1_61_12]OHD35362.1 MAG: V-type ATP synthase subunit D [Spirochaetes bacterium GWD1_61_31]OHD42485.1 MAG: V-type ATP synthase subunit D [Spirochaetes bacterium GWE1_60_18]OHD58213.1 MAG: V-type ATP synthase subunit D [Spirochaetes bacterium GWF1_60_12]HAP42931.1 V-type ATP synthase subunit D [Spirochaetaceae bacterium]